MPAKKATTQATEAGKARMLAVFPLLLSALENLSSAVRDECGDPEDGEDSSLAEALRAAEAAIEAADEIE